jgi:curved DNA-binding protein CbpA
MISARWCQVSVWRRYRSWDSVPPVSGMRQPPDPYRELGVPRGATDEQIKAAHRRLAKRFHPDASSGERERFMAIQEAYLLLTDPLRRREWDARHAPGPVRAPTAPSRGAPMARSRRGTPPRPDVTRTTARTSRGTTHGSSTTGRTASMPPREPGTQAYTWSAAGVPWWEDFQPKAATAGAAGGPGAAGGAGAAPGRSAPPPPPGPADPGTRPSDENPYVRSSGTAWSSAARRYFRQGDADLPRGGQFRYRGTQVVTGAEARRVADEEIRRSGGSAPGRGGPHGPTGSPMARQGLMARLRRMFGGG